MASTLVEARARLWEPTRISPFRYLWLGQSFSLLGDGFSYIAFSWITLSLTNSTLSLGFILAFQAVPRAVLTLVGGSLSDRLSPRRLMLLSSWARALVMTTVAVIGLADLLALWMLFVAAALFGAVDAFFQPARASILPTIVADKLVEPANALLSAGSRVASVIGPAVGGVVVAVTDANYAFLVDGLCFVACALCIARISPAESQAEGRHDDAAKNHEGGTTGTTVAPDPEPPKKADESFLESIRAGVLYAWTDPRIRAMLAVDTAVTFCYAGPFTVGFASLAKFQLNGGSASLGLLNGALAGGAIIGALAGGAVGRQLRLGLLVAALVVWLAVGMALLGFTTNLAVGVVVVLVMGFGIGFQGVFGLSWIQRNIEGAILSRVISVDIVCGYVAAPISLVLCGALAQVHPETLFIGTALILAVTALGILTSKPVRNMR